MAKFPVAILHSQLEMEEFPDFTSLLHRMRLSMVPTGPVRPVNCTQSKNMVVKFNSIYLNACSKCWNISRDVEWVLVHHLKRIFIHGEGTSKPQWPIKRNSSKSIVLPNHMNSINTAFKSSTTIQSQCSAKQRWARSDEHCGLYCRCYVTIIYIDLQLLRIDVQWIHSNICNYWRLLHRRMRTIRYKHCTAQGHWRQRLLTQTGL